MRKINRFPKTLFFSMGWEEKIEIAEAVRVYQEDIAKFLNDPECLESPLRDILPFVRAIDASSRGTYLQDFIIRRFNMRKSPKGQPGDGILNGDEVEIKSSLSASFKQIRFNDDRLNHYWFFSIAEDNTFKLYALNRDQVMKQSKEKGFPTTHLLTTGEFNKRDLYSVQFDPLTWRDCEIDCSCLNATKKQDYPDLFRTRINP